MEDDFGAPPDLDSPAQALSAHASTPPDPHGVHDTVHDARELDTSQTTHTPRKCTHVPGIQRAQSKIAQHREHVVHSNVQCKVVPRETGKTREAGEFLRVLIKCARPRCQCSLSEKCQVTESWESMYDARNGGRIKGEYVVESQPDERLSLEGL